MGQGPPFDYLGGGGGAWDAWKLCGGDVPSDEESLFLCGV